MKSRCVESPPFRDDRRCAGEILGRLARLDHDPVRQGDLELGRVVVVPLHRKGGVRPDRLAPSAIDPTTVRELVRPAILLLSCGALGHRSDDPGDLAGGLDQIGDQGVH